MWLEKIKTFRDENNIDLNLNLELHIAYFFKYLFKEHVEFTLVPTKSKNPSEKLQITLIEKKKKITNYQLFHWYQFDFHKLIFEEEKQIFKDFSDIRNKYYEAVEISKKNSPVIKGDDSIELKKEKQKTINENNSKLEVLNSNLKLKADESDKKIAELRKLRNMFSTYDSFETFISGLTNILKL